MAAGLFVPDPSMLPTEGPDVFARTPGTGIGGNGLAEMQAVAAAAPGFNPSFRRPTQTPGPDIWTNSARQFYVNGMLFDEDDAQSALDSEQLLNRPGRGAPPDNSGDWQAIDPQAYGQFLDSIKNPSRKRLAKKNFGIGLDNMQMLAGRGLQFAGAEQTGQNIVDAQVEDLRKTGPFQRRFTDIDSANGAVDWFVANLAQQGPNLIESIATAAAGFAGGTAVGGPLTGAGAALAGLMGKTAWKQSVLAAAKKKAAGAVLDGAEQKLLREAAGLAGATAATFTQNVTTGISDIYGEARDAGAGADDTTARMQALAGSAPYAALESLSEFVLAGRVLNPGNLKRSLTGRSLGGKVAELGRRAGVGLTVGGTLEGVTEAGQEGLLLGVNDGVDFDSPEGMDRLINSFAAGFGVGGPIGGVANLRGGKPADVLNPNNGKDPTSPVAPVAPEGDPSVGPQTPPFFQNVMPFEQPGEMPPLVGPAAGLAMPEADPNIGPMMAPQQEMDFAARGDQFDLFSEQPPPQQPVMSQWSPSQPIMGPDVPGGTLPNPAQGAMQFAAPPPAGNRFTQPVPRQERRAAEFDQAEAARIAAETDAAYQQRNLQQLPPSMETPLPPEWSNSGTSGELALDSMPMVPVAPTPPQQGNLFGRDAPRPSRAERLRKGIGPKQVAEPTNEELAAERDALLAERVTVTRAIAMRDAGGSRFAQKLKASPLASRLKAIDKRLSELPPAVLPDTGQMGMFTSAGNPTVAALKGAGKTQRVKPEPDTTVTQAPPTGKRVNPLTVAAARKKEADKSASDRGLKKQAGVKSEGKVDAVQERSPAPLDEGKQARSGRPDGARVAAAGQATGAASKLAKGKAESDTQPDAKGRAVPAKAVAAEPDKKERIAPPVAPPPKEGPPLPKTSAAAADSSAAAASPAPSDATITIEINGQETTGNGTLLLKSIDDRIEKFESLLACLTG